MKEISREDVIKKNNEVLLVLINELEKEATKEPKNTFNISALSEAIKVLKIV